MFSRLFLLVGISLGSALANDESNEFSPNDMQSKCHPITIEICKDLPYKETSYPNLIGYDESTAKLELDQYMPLIQAHQSFAKLKFFLCSVYVPMCTDKVPQAIGPCRPLCEEVKARAEPTLQHFGFNWPPTLNCSKFPAVNNAETMCMVGPATEGRTDEYGEERGDDRVLTEDRPSWAHPPSPCELQPGVSQLYVNRSSMCALQCDANARQPFTPAQRHIARTIAFCFAVMSVVMALVCCCVLVLRRRRVKNTFPHQCLLIITFSIACYSVTAMLSLMVYVTANLNNVTCSVTAILMYYFSTAAKIWWVHLCVTWLMRGTLGWTHKRMQTHRFALHMIAWGVPLIAVVSVLLVNGVDGDPLTGMCSVGSQSPHTHTAFVTAREMCILCVGGQALVFGTIHTVCQRQATSGAASELARGEQSTSMIISTSAAKPSSNHLQPSMNNYAGVQSCASSMLTTLPSPAQGGAHWRLAAVAWSYVPISVLLCVSHAVNQEPFVRGLIVMFGEGVFALVVESCCCAWLLFAVGSPSSQTMQRKQTPFVHQHGNGALQLNLATNVTTPSLPSLPPPVNNQLQYTQPLITQYEQSPVYHQYARHI